MRAWLVACTLLVACGDDAESVEDAGVRDAGASTDAPATDDGGPREDAGVDAGVPPAPWLRFERVPLEDEPSQLTDMEFVPGTAGDELMITTRDGRLLHYRMESEGGALLREVEVPGVYQESDCGLISIAFDPGYEENGRVFVGQCFSQHESGVVRFVWGEEGLEESVEVLRYGDEEATAGWHNVGSIGFDADRNLWALFGEKGVTAHAMDPGDPLGGVIRVRVDDEGVPSAAEGNPHETDDRFHPFVYAYGIRSPWRGAMDSAGRLWFGDVGAVRVEEVNLVHPGEDHGWPNAEGPCTREECEGSVDPLTSWGRGGGHEYIDDDPLADAIDWFRVAHVGLVYEPEDADPYEGWLTGATIYGDACVGFVRALEVDDEGEVSRDEAIAHLYGAAAWEVHPETGHIFAGSFGRCTTSPDALYPAGGLWRAELGEKPEGIARPATLPDRLSDWGLYPDAPMIWNTPTEAEFYEPRFPLWSNGSGKIRHVLLPETGGEPELVDGRYVWPLGTLFFKTFLFDGIPVETRVLRVSESRPVYGRYLWNEEGTDAELITDRDPAVVEVSLGDETFDHEIPGWEQCQGCHEAGDQSVLGYRPLQLEEDFPIPGDDETQAIIGWAQGNCTHCHDGSGGPRAAFSMLPDDFVGNTVGVPAVGSAGAGGLRIAPGLPDESAMVQSFSRESDEYPVMPPLGVQRRDDGAYEALRSWIASLPPAMPDGGVPDGGTPDAGVSDGGTPDAGTPDAGTPDADGD